MVTPILALAFGCFEFTCVALFLVGGMVAVINVFAAGQKPVRNTNRQNSRESSTAEPAKAKPRREPIRAQRTVRAPAKPQPPKPASGHRVRPAETVVDPKVGSKDLGQGLSAHLREAMSERVGEQAQRDLSNRVSASVAAHLGSESEAPVVSIPAGKPSTQMLIPKKWTCDNLRSAFILQEVMRRPNFRR